MIGSNVLAAIKQSLSSAKTIHSSERILAAERALEYYRSITYQQGDLTDSYRALYDPSSDWYTRPKACYSLTAGVADALSSLYHDPVTRSWPEDAAGAAAEEMFAEAGDFNAIMAAVDVYTFLTGTVLVRPMAIKDGDDVRVAFGIYPSHHVEIVQSPLDPTVAEQVTVSWRTGQGEAQGTVAQTWTADGWVETKDDVKVDEGDNAYGCLPFVVFRNAMPLWDYYGEPASDLVQANLTLNKLLTDLNHVVAYQTAGVLVIKGAAPNYVPKLGPGRYVRLDGVSEASASFIQPGADIPACIEAINQNLRMFFSARRIPEAAIMARQSGESGVSLVAQAQSLADYRQRRINAFRQPELDLIALTLQVIAQDARGTQPPDALPSVEYTELSEAFDAEDMAEWDWKFRNKVATPIDYLLAANPGMTREEAAERYAANKAFFSLSEAPPMFGLRRAPAVIEPATEAMDEEDEDEVEEEPANGE